MKLPKKHLADLWDLINETRCYQWDSNPWVWIVKFKRID